MRLLVAVLLVPALAAPAAAQMAYRHVFPDGRMVYSDRPVPGAEVQEALTPPPPAAAPAPAQDAAASPGPAVDATTAPVAGARWPPPPGADQPSPVAASAPDQAQSSPAMPVAQPASPDRPLEQAPQDRIARFGEADDAVRAAERHLAAAKASLDAGEVPLPGERTGLAGGGSRLNEAYWDRQAQLKRAVADAQAQLDRAVAERNARR
jgi:hypothetical protein